MKLDTPDILYCNENISQLNFLEIIIIGLCSYYIPQNISHVILTTIYILNNTVTNKAALEISEALRNYESSAPDALINGDINLFKLLQIGNQYYQHIHCTTRNTATLDYCYSNVRLILCNSDRRFR